MMSNDCFFQLLDGAESGHREHTIAHDLLDLHISRLSGRFLRQNWDAFRLNCTRIERWRKEVGHEMRDHHRDNHRDENVDSR